MGGEAVSDGKRWARLRTGQPYEMLGLIYFVSCNYRIMPEDIRAAIRDCCRKAAGRSGNEAALMAYLTERKSKTWVCMTWHIASETTVDRMVRSYYIEMEKALKAAWAK